MREKLIDGVPYFVIFDACKMLDLSNVTMVLERLSRDDISQIDVMDSLGRNHKMWVGNEYALYDLILRSEKPNARKIQHWLTHEARARR